MVHQDKGTLKQAAGNTTYENTLKWLVQCKSIDKHGNLRMTLPLPPPSYKTGTRTWTREDLVNQSKKHCQHIG